MNNKEIKELTKVLNQINRRRMDPLSKLFLLVVIGVPVLVIGLIILGVTLYKKHKGTEVKKSKKLTVVEERKPKKFNKPSELYYEVVRLKAEEQSLTQYIRLYVNSNNDFKDVTEEASDNFNVLTKYVGRSKVLKGTVVLTDFDIIQFQQELGTTRLIRTVSM